MRRARGDDDDDADAVDDVGTCVINPFMRCNCMRASLETCNIDPLTMRVRQGTTLAHSTVEKGWPSSETTEWKRRTSLMACTPHIATSEDSWAMAFSISVRKPFHAMGRISQTRGSSLQSAQTNVEVAERVGEGAGDDPSAAAAAVAAAAVAAAAGSVVVVVVVAAVVVVVVVVDIAGAHCFAIDTVRRTTRITRERP